MYSDAELVLQAHSGDRQAFAAIYDRYADRVHDFCYSVLRDRDEAADAMQDTFVLAAQRMGQLHDPSKLRSWLFAVACHESIRRGKARRRMATTDRVGDDAVSDDSSPEAVVSRGDAQEIVWSAAAGLSDRDRALLDLHLRQDLDGHELADAIGVSPAHAYTLMNRLRDQVERSLGALLVARLGRDDCPELQRLLEPWDGSFTPLWRKRVAHHVDECDVCSDRRQVLASPLSLLAAAPLVPAPIALRSFTLDRMEGVTTHGGGGNGHGTSNNGNGTHGWSDRLARGGFPPGVDDTSWNAPSRLARSALGIAAAALLAVFVFGATYLMFNDDEQASTVVAAKSVTTTRGPAPVTAVAPGPSVPPTSKPASRREEPRDTTPEGEEVSTGGGESTPSSTTTTTTTQPDNTPPVVTVRVAAPVIYEEDSTCTTSTTATAGVQDASPIKSVIMEYKFGSVSISVPMTAGGGAYAGPVGPFPVGTVMAPTTFTITVTALDEAGNEGPGSTTMTLNPAADCNPVS